MAFNDSYKRWHKPNMSGTKAQGGTSRTSQGYYKVKHPEKYIGDPNLVIYRSSWEMAFCRWCDASPSITRWASEPIKIPYYDRVSKLEECKKYNLDPNSPKNWAVKNYNLDFWIEIANGDGTSQKMFIEVKPSSKLKKPLPPPLGVPLKVQKRFVIEAKEFLINEAKFAAAEAWANKHNAKFKIFTEDVLRSQIGRFWSANND